MSQLTGITPTKTLGQCIGDLLSRPAYKRPPERAPQDRPNNTGARGKSFTGVPGIAFRDNVFTVTMFTDSKRHYLGSFVNLRTAIQVLAEARGMQPEDLRGVSLSTWERLKFQQKFLPDATKRGMKS